VGANSAPLNPLGGFKGSSQGGGKRGKRKAGEEEREGTREDPPLEINFYTPSEINFWLRVTAL